MENPFIPQHSDLIFLTLDRNDKYSLTNSDVAEFNFDVTKKMENPFTSRKFNHFKNVIVERIPKERT